MCHPSISYFEIHLSYRWYLFHLLISFVLPCVVLPNPILSPFPVYQIWPSIWCTKATGLATTTHFSLTSPMLAGTPFSVRWTVIPVMTMTLGPISSENIKAKSKTLQVCTLTAIDYHHNCIRDCQVFMALSRGLPSELIYISNIVPQSFPLSVFFSVFDTPPTLFTYN